MADKKLEVLFAGEIVAWTPCREALPEKRGLYLVTVEIYSSRGKKVNQRMLLSGYYTKTDGWNLSCGKVIAWAPFPDVYNGD